MKRTTRVFGARALRSGRRLFATRYEEEVKRPRLSPVPVVDTQEYKKLNGNGIDEEEGIRIKLEEPQIINRYGIDEVMGINGEEEQEDIKLGEIKKTSLADNNGGDNVSCTKQFGAVYTRKRKRTLSRDSSLKCSSFEETCGSDNRYAKKYFKKVRTSKQSDCCHSMLGFDGKDVPISRCSYGSVDSSSSIHQFSCFMSSNGIRFLQDSTCTMTMSHGFCKVFGSIFSTPFFTVDINAFPFCFLYMHSTLLLKFALLSSAFIMHSFNEIVMNDDVKLPLMVATQRDQSLDKHMIVRKARSARKTVPRFALFKKCFQRSVWGHVENVVPVPVVREIEGYEEDGYVPFMLPESYIRSRSDEVSRSLEKSYPIYDMDSDDERWLKELNNERFGYNELVSEDSFEKIIDAFERGSYCTLYCFSDAASAIDRYSRLASKENVEAVYSYWMAKRKKKRSPLIRVFQCYPRKRAKGYFTNVVMRKKRSSRRRASQRCVGKQLDFFKASILNDENKLAKMIVKVHEAEEGARRAEAAAIVKRQEAQAAMETADLATYRAAMALRIAAAAAGGGSVVDCL